MSLETVRKEMVATVPRLRRFALSLVGNLADADDLVQDTIERALKNLHRWQEGSRLDSWMFRIAQNIWIDRRRSAKVRDRISGSSDEAALASVDGEREAESKITFAAMIAALDELPEEQRIAVSLVLIDGQSYRDAAQTLGIPLGTLTSRLARAREALAARVFGTEQVP